MKVAPIIAIVGAVILTAGLLNLPVTEQGSGKIDIIGYYGNSGNAVSAIPRLLDVDANYNVIILTFADVDSQGNFDLIIQGPYDGDFDGLAADVAKWKAKADPWGRRKAALVSIGGQNGSWPAGVSASRIEAGLNKFLNRFNLDGLDIDLEGQAVLSAKSLVPVIQSLTSSGKLVTAAPEASQYPLNAYKDMLKHLSWVHPQFYNNGPNGVTVPFVPSADRWPTPWTVRDWQEESGSESFWAGVLGAIGKSCGLPKSKQGMLFPANSSAAGSYNRWDIDRLARQVHNAGVTHVGTWAIAYDHQQGYRFAKAIGALNN